jgi:hypothetical protein
MEPPLFGTLLSASLKHMDSLQSTDISSLLDKIGVYQRAPYRLKELLATTNQAPDSTAYMFLQEGFGPWVAYILAERESGQQDTSPGKPERARIIGLLETATSQSKKALAARVAAAIDSDLAFKEKLNAWNPETPQTGAVRRPKRRRKIYYQFATRTIF